MASLQLHFTPPFLEALEKVKAHRSYKSQSKRLQAALHALSGNVRPLDRIWCDHPLKGRFQSLRAVHVSPDLVLLYSVTETTVELLDLGTHREVYGIE